MNAAAFTTRACPRCFKDDDPGSYSVDLLPKLLYQNRMNQYDKIVEGCVARLQATADELALEGADRFLLVVALVEVIVQTAYEDRPRAAVQLEEAAAFLANAIEGAHLDKEVDDIRKAFPDPRRRQRRKSKKK